MSERLLDIRHLTVAFPVDGREVAVVRDLSLDVGAGEIVGLVGESGSGKSVTALAALDLVPEPGRISHGEIRFRGRDLLKLPERELRRVRGAGISLVFQEPMTAFNPVFTIGYQIVEAIRAHRPVGRREAYRRAAELLERVAIADPGERLHDYPHQLSGGQCQRAMIAMALAAGPDLLIADEPTTALDVTVQAQILELLESLRAELGLAVLLITHDLAVVAETCDRVLVMYAGREVEKAPVERLFSNPAHPYTRALLASAPRLGRPGARGGLPVIPGQVPEPSRLPPGCPFHPRCAEALPECRETDPPLYAVSTDQEARCVLHRPAGESE